MKLKWLLGVSALFVASCSAFFSVTGLGLLFHGASASVIVMASSLELAKLVTAAYLKQKWEELARLLKIYLSLAVFILMIITSLGIYGYLSDAFQQQNLELQKVDREVSLIDNKIKVNEREINRYEDKITNLAGIRNSQEKNYSKLIEQEKGTSRIYNMIKSADAEIKSSSLKVDSLNSQNVILYQQIDSVKNANIGLEKKIGGFRFVSEALGVDMNTAVKWFILLLVFVFDPLAVAMVLAYVRFSPSQPTKPSQPKEKVFVPIEKPVVIQEPTLKQQSQDGRKESPPIVIAEDKPITKKITAKAIAELYELDRYLEGTSQNGEENYITHILSYIGETNFLVEVLDKKEHHFSNIRHLLNNGYQGFIIEQDQEETKNHWRSLICQQILDEIKKANIPVKVPQPFDALSIDLNGNDFWLLDEVLKYFRPKLIVAEFNPAKEGSVAIRFNSLFKWAGDDYYGFSFEAGKTLAEKYGYYVIFQNDNINLYMVAKEYVDVIDIPEVKYEKRMSFAQNTTGEWVNV